MKINSRNKLSGEIVLVIGIVLTVTGVSIWGLTWYNIVTREQTLSYTNLSVEERWRVEGSLRWWRDFSARLSYRLGAALFIGGLFTIALSDHLKGIERKQSFNEGAKGSDQIDSIRRTLVSCALVKCSSPK